MTEPDVALTDFALALECGVFCALAARWPRADASLRRWWTVLFASITLGSVLGGLVHGFFRDETTATYSILWPATLIALGVTAAAMWMIGLGALRGTRLGAPAQAAIWGLVAVYAGIVIFVTSSFVLAIAAYVPATVFLIVVFTLFFRRAHARRLAYGIAGLALTLGAAAVQQLRIAIHPVYFNHNALYHAIQAIALLLVFLGARPLSER